MADDSSSSSDGEIDPSQMLADVGLGEFGGLHGPSMPVAATGTEPVKAVRGGDSGGDSSGANPAASNVVSLGEEHRDDGGGDDDDGDDGQARGNDAAAADWTTIGKDVPAVDAANADAEPPAVGGEVGIVLGRSVLSWHKRWNSTSMDTGGDDGRDNSDNDCDGDHGEKVPSPLQDRGYIVVRHERGRIPQPSQTAAGAGGATEAGTTLLEVDDSKSVARVRYPLPPSSALASASASVDAAAGARGPQHEHVTYSGTAFRPPGAVARNTLVDCVAVYDPNRACYVLEIVDLTVANLRAAGGGRGGVGGGGNGSLGAGGERREDTFFPDVIRADPRMRARQAEKEVRRRKRKTAAGVGGGAAAAAKKSAPDRVASPQPKKDDTKPQGQKKKRRKKTTSKQEVNDAGSSKSKSKGEGKSKKEDKTPFRPKSGYWGVTEASRKKKGTCYRAQAAVDGKLRYLGTFDTAVEAARKYDEVAREENSKGTGRRLARLNFPEEEGSADGKVGASSKKENG